MKKAAVLLLFAAAAYASAPEGRVVIHIAGGFEVLVDGASAGQTTVEQGGKILDLPEGPHHIVVRSVEGREAPLDVTIVANETQDVTISPLGFRRRLAPVGTAGALEVSCIPADCTMAFKPAVDAVPPGRHALAVSRGKTTLRTEIDVPQNTLVVVEANFNSGKIRVIDSRPRPVHVDVAETGDALTRLQVPAAWKESIRKGLPSAATIESATLQQPNVVKVVARISLSAPAETSKKWSEMSDAEKIEIVGTRQAGNDMLIDLLFYFEK